MNLRSLALCAVLGVSALFATSSTASAQGLSIQIGPGGVYVGPRYDYYRPYYQPYRNVPHNGFHYDPWNGHHWGPHYGPVPRQYYPHNYYRPYPMPHPHYQHHHHHHHHR